MARQDIVVVGPLGVLAASLLMVLVGAPLSATHSTSLQSGSAGISGVKVDVSVSPPRTTAEIVQSEGAGTPSVMVSARQERARRHPSARRGGWQDRSAALTATEFVGGGFAQTLGTPNVDTITYLEAPFIPPDPSGDVGPDQYLLATNAILQSHLKSHGAPDGQVSATLAGFFQSVRADQVVARPRVRYDRRAGRWYVLAMTLAVPNRLVLAVSDGPTLTTSTVWSFVALLNGYQATAQPTPGASCLADFPTLGVDEDALYIGVNQYCGAAAPGPALGTLEFDATSGIVINKASLLADPSTAVVTAFHGLALGDGPGPFSPQGADNFDVDTDEGYFIGVDNAAFGQLQLRRVFDPGGVNPTISENVAVPVAATEFPASVPHPGSSTPLGTIDDRLNNVVVRHGRLWTSHQVEVDATGEAIEGGGRTAIRWYELQDLGGTPSVHQFGTIFDAAAIDPQSYFTGSLMVSGQGHVALGSTVAGPTTFVNAATTGRLAGDPPGQMNGAPQVYTTNAGAIYDRPEQDPGPTQPWGSYSSTSIDPSDDMTMWTLQQWVDVQNSYGLRLVRLMAPPPASPISVTPAVLTTGRSGLTVTVSGATTGGAGYFDPGAGVPAGLTAVFTGSGITVTAIAVDSPTQLTLTLDTTSAVPGTYPLVVTNPDGQTSSLAEAVDVQTNDAPVAMPDGYTVRENGTLQIAAPGVLSNDSDANGEPLSAVLESPPSHGLLTLNADGSFTYTPTPGYAGSDAFTYVASDGLLPSSPATVSLTVQPNAVPVAVGDVYATAYATPLTVPAPGVLANDTDADGDPLTAVLVAGPAAGTLTLNADGSFVYTPPALFAGTASFTYRASDTAATSDLATVTITVGEPGTVLPPSGLYVSRVSGNLVTLRWAAPPVGPTPTGFVVEGGVSPGEVLASFATGSPAPIFTFTAPTGSFYARVHALAGTQRSGPSNEVRLHVNVPVPPSAPEGLVGLVNGTTLNLAWRNTFAGGAPTSLLLDVSGSVTATLPVGAGESFGFTGVPGGSYVLRLRAVNAGGTSSASSPVSLTFPGTCSGAPEPPVNALVYNLGRTLFVTWDPAGAGPAPTAFVATVGGAYTGSFSTTGRALSGVVNPGTYTISIVAQNSCGVSTPTATYSVTVP